MAWQGDDKNGKARHQGMDAKDAKDARQGRKDARDARDARTQRTQGKARTQQQDAGRQNAAKWRSIVIQILKEC